MFTRATSRRTLVVVDLGLDVALRERFDEALLALKGRGNYSVESADTQTMPPKADVYFVCGSQNETLLAELEEVARSAPDKLRRTILVGPAFDFVYGWGRSKEGTVADSMEKYGMGGWIAPDALTSWGHVGLFAGPKTLMAPMQANALKGFQSRSYATWFSSRCDSLDEFLARYLPLMIERAEGRDAGA